MKGSTLETRVWWHAAAVAVVIIAAYAALHKLGYRSMWYDEIRTLQVYAAQPFDLRNGDPPLYSLYVRALRQWTTDEFWLRLPNAVGLVAIAGIISWLWRRWLAPAACVCAGVACATSVALLTTGQMVRPYGFNVACTVLAYTAFVRLLETRSWRWLALYVSAAVLALYTQYSAVLLCGVHFVTGTLWVVTQRQQRGRIVLLGAVAMILAGALAAPWYMPLYRGLAGLIASTPAPRQELTVVAFGAIVNQKLFHSIPVWVILALMTAGVALSAVRRNWFVTLVTCLWLVSGFAFVYWYTTTRGMFLEARYYLFFLPPAYVLAASGVAELVALASRCWQRRGWVTSLVTLSVWGAVWWPSLAAWRAYQRYHRNTDSRQVAALSRHVSARGIPVIYNGWHLAFNHYPHALQRGDPHHALQQTEPVYYLTDRPYDVLVGPTFARYDAVQLPYHGTPEVFVLFRERTAWTNYIARAAAVVRDALALDPRHAQMRELLAGLEQLMPPAEPRQPSRVTATRQNDILLSPRAWRAVCGWGAVERWPDDKTARWSIGRVAALRVPHHSGLLRRIVVQACAFVPHAGSQQPVTAWLNGVCLGEQQVVPAWQEVTWEVRPYAAPGEHVLAFDIRYPCPPAAVGAGGDTRALGMAVSAIRLELLPPLPLAELDIGANDDHAWLDGAWSHAEQWDGIGSFRWITNSVARIIWYQGERLEAGVWQLHMLPFAAEGTVQRINVWQDGALLSNVTLAPKWATYEIVSPRSGSDVVELALQFTHLQRPREVGKGDDSRPLAAAVARVRRVGPASSGGASLR